jgi:hypothetical protein
LLTSNCFPFRKKVKGDGNVITKEIAISDYQAIRSQGASLKIDYTQSNDAPGLTVTVDQNVFEMYDFEVRDGELRIEPKKTFKRDQFAPTRFTVVTHSTNLRKVESAGRVEFSVNGPLQTDELKFSLAGSGTVNLKESVTARKLDIEMAGSGTLNASALSGETFKGNIAGSGEINLGGRMTSASFEIAGSGTVHAFDLQAEDVKCEIAGSGNLEIYANSRIQANVAGSGKVRYRGTPSNVDTDIAGSGSVRKAD